MFDETVIRQLKQSNVSVDAEKTKERVELLWKSLSRKNKQAVLALAGVSPATVYRIYNTGSISAKLAVPLAQVLDVDPAYLTGAADEQGTCGEEALRKFLADHGYSKLLAAAPEKAGRKRQPKVKTAEAAEVLPEAQPIPEVQPAPVDSVPDEIAEDDMILLLRSVLLKAKLGAPDAVRTSAKLRELLISE